MNKILLPLYWKVSSNKFYAGKHWSVRDGIKNDYRSTYLNEVKKLDKQTVFPISITFNFTFKSHPLDASNCATMAKLLEDLMAEAEVIPNDGFKIVREINLSTMKGVEDTVEIIIKEVNNGK